MGNTWTPFVEKSWPKTFLRMADDRPWMKTTGDLARVSEGGRANESMERHSGWHSGLDDGGHAGFCGH
jgi:hypothetical protein